MHLFISGVIVGILLGGVYALMTSGLAVVWGVMRVLNIAHAAAVVLGSYLAYSAFQQLHIDPIVSILIIAPVMFLLGVGLYYVFLRPLRKDREALAVLVTYALAAGIEGLLGLVYSTDFRLTQPSYSLSSFLVLGYRIPAVQFYAFLLSVAVLGVLSALMKGTRFGRALRAATQNPNSALLLGVKPHFCSALGYGIGMATAAVAGALYGMIYSFDPASQLDLIGVLLAIVVLGGLGSMWGTVVAALALGIVASVTGVYFPLWSNFVFFGSLAVVLLIRPQGLGGARALVNR